MGVGTLIGTYSQLMVSMMLCLFPVIDDIDDGRVLMVSPWKQSVWFQSLMISMMGLVLVWAAVSLCGCCFLCSISSRR
jgi:hypothetical protein